ncbi:hypothetical protein llap_10367 [Limosa lapponica baueri]|uniref:Uncharacterized protein n=1 Tax=Limosa lapponica baueri TaxID=1758121 RepID=A0A2I0U067_LIMLA|nr:hypothetical protein llap_10367 [Limosa lapponica baueri]
MPPPEPPRGTVPVVPLPAPGSCRESGGDRGIEIPRGRRLEDRRVGLGKQELDRKMACGGEKMVVSVICRNQQ